MIVYFCRQESHVNEDQGKAASSLEDRESRGKKIDESLATQKSLGKEMIDESLATQKSLGKEEIDESLDTQKSLEKEKIDESFDMQKALGKEKIDESLDMQKSPKRVNSWERDPDLPQTGVGRTLHLPLHFQALL
ncbi:hypothetical protein SK128_004613 [Halocaridina rubra]|uniref:Uncharacterized protein n=1 Tax=Halocaridina rubra TaxID=373956 RepID=A0AAN8WZU9_HALRR